MRTPGRPDRFYPAWQFGPDGRPLPSLPRVLAAARAAALDDGRLAELMSTRRGLRDRRRLSDALHEGAEEHVLAAIRAAGTARASQR